MTILLAFLAPDLVRAAIDGRLPHGMGVARLTDLPAVWCRQYVAARSCCALTASDQVPPASLPSFPVDRKPRTEPPGNLSERARSSMV
jgi:hypothetical protein